MKDEIKEILDNKLYFDLEEEDYIKIKDYITNLQEENERLKKRNKEIYDGFIATQEELSDYATRNEKARKYIKDNGLYEDEYNKFNDDLNYDELNELLNILNGGDEELLEEVE